MRIAVLQPGAMGETIGAALVGAGHGAYWVTEGRSPATRARAQRANLQALRTLADLTEMDAVISVCPPEAALAQANAVVAQGFRGIYVDANAVAPGTARAIAELVRSGGGRFVDGGIIGPPARRRGTTRLYLSGDQAGDVMRWFEGTPLEAIAIEGGAGAASALKMCYAAYTKGTSALLIAIRTLATAEGVAEALVDEWQRSQPGLAARSEQGAAGAAPKAWRFAGEMDEIATSFEQAGLPGDFHRGAAALYRRLAEFKDREDVHLDEVVSTLLARR